jgi:hypothetical protein
MLNLLLRLVELTLEDLISETNITWGFAEYIIRERCVIFSLPRFLPMPWQFHPRALTIEETASAIVTSSMFHQNSRRIGSALHDDRKKLLRR